MKTLIKRTVSKGIVVIKMDNDGVILAFLNGERIQPVGSMGLYRISDLGDSKFHVDLYKNLKQKGANAVLGGNVALFDGETEIIETAQKEFKKKGAGMLEKAAPGYHELKKAYLDRSIALDKNEAYTERGHMTSIFSGDGGNVKENELKVTALEEKYPIAKKYIKYCAGNYRERRAARALYNGSTLKDAEQLANDYAPWN